MGITLSSKRRAKVRSLAQHLIELMSVMLLFELLLIVSVVGVGRYWLIKIGESELQANVTQIAPEFRESLILQKVNGNKPAFEFLIYELIQSRKLDYAAFFDPDELRAYLASKRLEDRCPDIHQRFYCKLNDNHMVGLTPLEFDKQLLGYVVQEGRVSISRAAIGQKDVIYFGIALGCAFFVNLFGVVVIFRRRVSREINQLKGAIDAFRDETVLDSDATYSVAEFGGIVLALKEAVQLRESVVDSRQKAIRAESMLNTAQMLAHDVRRPLSIILAGLEVLREERDPAEMMRKFERLAVDVRRRTIEVNGMLDDLLELGRKTDLILERTNLTNTIEGSLKDFDLPKSRPGVALVWSSPGDIFVRANAKKLSRVFANIFANAFEATNDRTTLSITLNVQGKSVKCVITNTGSFVPANLRETIFDVFFTSGKANGSGLGMAIARRVIEDHGGTIVCESDEIARTVSFIIELPMD